RQLQRALLATGAAAILLALLELPALLGGVDWQALLLRRDDFVIARVQPWRNAWNVRDAELLFRRPPHAHLSGSTPGDCAIWLGVPSGRSSSYDLRYDGDGFRNPRELERADVAVVGDSFVEGCLVGDDETVTAQLAHALHVDVVNLALGGYGP